MFIAGCGCECFNRTESEWYVVRYITALFQTALPVLLSSRTSSLAGGGPVLTFSVSGFVMFCNVFVLVL